MDPDQDRQNVGPDLGPYRLQNVSPDLGPYCLQNVGPDLGPYCLQNDGLDLGSYCLQNVGPDLGPYCLQMLSGSKPLDTLIVILKESFKISADNKSMVNYPACMELILKAPRQKNASENVVC